MREKGVDYYNIEKEKDKIGKDIVMTSRSSLLAEATPPSNEERGFPPQGEETESGYSTPAAPIGEHNVKRAIFQLFVNDNKRKVAKVRLNLTDDQNVEFVAALQPKSIITNFLKHTGEHKEDAREWFKLCRQSSKQIYGTTPQQGKWHMKANTYASGKIQTVTVEPECYVGVAYDQELKEYALFAKLYDLIIWNEHLDSGYVTEKQRQSGVRGQYLWINPQFDTRSRPKTFAQRQREGGL